MADRAVCVLGAGLIGGSLLRAAQKAGREVWGTCASERTAAEARADGFDVDTDTDRALRRAAAADALVVLAVPLPVVPELLRRVDVVAPTCRLTDAVSVKVAVSDAVRAFAPRACYVGGHPMAGTAESGWAAGSAALFADAVWVVAAVLAAVGASEGDALALALAASSFADGTRVAGTRPELVLAMCEGNRDALLAAVDDALGRLGVMRGALASTGGLAATVNAGFAARARWAAARERPAQRVSLTGAAPLAALRELGRRGEVVIGWA